MEPTSPNGGTPKINLPFSSRCSMPSHSGADLRSQSHSCQLHLEHEFIHPYTTLTLVHSDS